jgi:hypothetical protein
VASKFHDSLVDNKMKFIANTVILKGKYIYNCKKVMNLLLSLAHITTVVSGGGEYFHQFLYLFFSSKIQTETEEKFA